MSEYTFKNLNEIDNVPEPADGTTVMGFENGMPIQMPMRAIKGSGGVFIINPDDSEYSTVNGTYGNKVKEVLLSGKQIWFYNSDGDFYTPIIAFWTGSHTANANYLAAVPAIINTTKGKSLNSNGAYLEFVITL